MNKQDEITRHYNNFYAQGGWSYDTDLQREFLRTRIIKQWGMQPGQKLLEIGCGVGLHAELLQQAGLDVTAVDISPVAIARAKKRLAPVHWHCMSAAEVPARFMPGAFDYIYVRGMSWYHYQLDGLSPQTGVNVFDWTRLFFNLLKPGGLFVLQIRTDFSGNRPRNDVHDNTWYDYVGLFESMGNVRGVINWAGELLRSQEEALALGNNVIIATERLPHDTLPGVKGNGSTNPRKESNHAN